MTTTPGITKVGTNLYRIRVRATCPRTGRRKEIERERACSLTEARALQVQWRDELIETLANARPARVRLRDFAASWLAGREGEIKLGTAKHIASVWDLHIASTKIADLYVDDIRPEDVEQWIAEMRAKTWTPTYAGRAKSKREARRYSGSTIRIIYAKLRQIIRAACARARVPNPCETVRAPKSNRPRPNYLRAHEAARVLAWVRDHRSQWYAAVLLDLTTGLRWSELSALRWDDIDEAEGVIRVSRGQYKGRAQDSTKNGEDERAPRVVPLLDDVAKALREHRQRLIREQNPGLAEGWVFPSRSGKLHKGSPISDLLREACAEVGTKYRITAHGLRHTGNDLIRRVASGVVTKAIIGHASDAMSAHYSHVDEHEKRAAVSLAFASVLGGSGGTPGGTPA